MNKPNPQSKTARVILQAQSVDEIQTVKAFKKLCFQDGKTEKDMLLEAVELLFVKHHLDIGGNPQRQLIFSDKVEQSKLCRCGRVAVKHGVHLASSVERDYCDKCFCEVLGRHDPKVWQWRTP